ncbi:hypothetical protein BaRGS_00032646 [Batillaria attramentaria]|uniref:Uncharacterized protein n=1 Tax=Batillaria attramentaria TaxID=370345 RepID=A0ABD0JM79_9CAEN
MPAPFGVIYHSPGVPEDTDQSNSTDQNCTDGLPFYMVLFGDCVRPHKDIRIMASDISGVISMALWMVVGVPQLIKTCCNINGAGGMSKFLLLFWILGDTTNLIGAILTHQLKAQVYIAVWYVCQDILMSAQYLYYRFKKRRERIAAQRADAAVRARDEVAPVVLCLSGFLTLWAWTSPVGGPSQTFQRRPAGRTLLWAAEQDSSIFHGVDDIIGYIVGILSAILYVFSRATQIRKNYKRKSTEGVSSLMFVMTVLGNATYGASILIRSVEEIYILRHLPWLVGSLGIIFLDVTHVTAVTGTPSWERRTVRLLSHKSVITISFIMNSFSLTINQLLVQSIVYGTRRLEFDVLVNEPLIKEEEDGSEEITNYAAINN